MLNGSNAELSGVKDFRRLDLCVIPSAIHYAAGLSCLKPKFLVNGCQRLECSVGDSEGNGERHGERQCNGSVSSPSVARDGLLCETGSAAGAEAPLALRLSPLLSLLR